jgi:hypothetical protein
MAAFVPCNCVSSTVSTNFLLRIACHLPGSDRTRWLVVFRKLSSKAVRARVWLLALLTWSGVFAAARAQGYFAVGLLCASTNSGENLDNMLVSSLCSLGPSLRAIVACPLLVLGWTRCRHSASAILCYPHWCPASSLPALWSVLIGALSWC